ncbi:putative mRNA export factor rsm1 [Cladorrhinum sp. PSN332]|nr:putative mRNA export factor rsm1 [Cladorrhinum sp. PSN332]
MNATVKRKFNALVQGIGSNSTTSENDSSSNTLSTTDPAGVVAMSSSPLSMRSAPNISRSLTNSGGDDLLNKKRRVGGGAPTSTTPTPSRFGTPQRNKSDATLLAASPAGSIRAAGSGTGTAATSISNITLRKWTPGRSESPAPSSLIEGGGLPPPKYCPGDRDQLLRRLATFQELTDWTPKPDRVNEVEWAKRGWVCQGKERVRCLLCEAELVVKINKKEIDGREISVLIASEIEEGVVRRYAELVVESHRGDCLWRKKGCDDSLLRLPLPNPKLALATLRARYDELCSRSAAFLPYEFNLRLPEGLDLDEIISHLPSTFFSSNPTPSYPNSDKISRPALALALLGWQGLTNPRLSNAPIPNSASCHTCLRRLGLWMFKSKEVDTETNQVLVPAPMGHLDPVVEHRFFCPWKNGNVQRNPGSKDEKEAKPAWEVLKEVLRNESFIRSKVEHSNHGRSKSAAAAAGVAKTPERRRPITSGTGTGGPGTPASVAGTEGGEVEGEEETRKKKDQDMMSRLRRVKSLFNTKGGGSKKSGGTVSRPGTSHSTRGGES